MRTDFAGYSVKFSPFRQDIFAIATAQHFGMVGNGKLVIANTRGQVLSQVLTREGCFDVAFSEEADSLVCACTGGGEVLFFDIAKNAVVSSVPKAHASEASSVDFHGSRRELLVSSGWDQKCNIWDINRLQAGPVLSFHHHQGQCYQAVFSPHQPRLLASVGADGRLLVSDLYKSSPALEMQHGSEVLCCDWDKYNPQLIATGSVDRLVRFWDIRNPSVPVSVLSGHSLAVRRVKCHPHVPNEVVSCS